ncbi:MAG: hydantoinase/oxoprolinase family protein [Deltaproteobacteria bacterium]|nr:hydantoinase/oxoprolinase family protein [Deltaproteobacteria bacterium]
MILGLDVGGTQTDAVLVCEGQVAAHVKVVNRPDLLETLSRALDGVLSGVGVSRIRRMVFSTTMATNAVVTDRLDPAGMIVTAGPGMDPEWFSVGPAFHVVGGCLDHRGEEVVPVDEAAVKNAAAAIHKKDIDSVGIAGKFSVRNPDHELAIATMLQGSFTHLVLGHRFSGLLNFPRRIATTYLNAALTRLHTSFLESLEQVLRERGLNAPRYLMKPDGGTVRLAASANFPAETVQSGPAASVMGALATDGCPGQTLVLDIGGTTTDMALVLDGMPLYVPKGITLGPFATNIRSLLTRSIGMGGDSEISTSGKRLAIGPNRQGPPMAFGGPAPTPTDAMVVLGLLAEGDAAKARQAMEQVGAARRWDAKTAAREVLESMARNLAIAAKAFVHYVNSRPVYTIYEVIEGVRLEPDGLVALGGPAAMLAPYLEQAFGLPVRVPDHFSVANAVGAAASRVTTEISLHADTRRGVLVVPEVGLETSVRRDFTMETAMEVAKQSLAKRAAEEGATAEHLDFAISEKESFNMIRNGARAGRNIRLKLSLAPGLIPEWTRKEEAC